MSDRLSFETVQEPVVPEQNRLFVIIAIGLVGMLVLGLLGIGGYVVFARTKHASAVVSPPTAVAFISAATPTVMATNTPAPTLAPAMVKLTNTPVVLAPTVAGPSLGGVINPTRHAATADQDDSRSGDVRRAGSSDAGCGARSSA